MRNKILTCPFEIGLALAVGFVFLSINIVGAAEKDSEFTSCIPLKFTPVPIQSLKEVQPNRGWKRAKTAKIKVMPGREASIDFYIDLSTKVEGENIGVHAFIQDGRSSHDVGCASSYGVADVIIEEIQPHDSRASQWAIHGTLGAAGDCTRVVAFDSKDKRWKRLLDEEGNRTGLLDLDGDGEKEILNRFGPGNDITVFRWKLDHFESVSIAKASENGLRPAVQGWRQVDFAGRKPGRWRAQGCSLFQISERQTRGIGCCAWKQWP